MKGLEEMPVYFMVRLLGSGWRERGGGFKVQGLKNTPLPLKKIVRTHIIDSAIYLSTYPILPGLDQLAK